MEKTQNGKGNVRERKFYATDRFWSRSKQTFFKIHDMSMINEGTIGIAYPDNFCTYININELNEKLDNGQIWFAEPSK